MSTTMAARTARIPHTCENCDRAPGLRGVATILPGHRYLRHVVFPNDMTNQSDRPWVVKECAACASEREQAGSVEPADAGACLTYCHGVTPCARPIRHADQHECRTCAVAASRRSEP